MIQSIINDIKIFNGDLYGETVRDINIMKKQNIDKIYARIDARYSLFLMKVLTQKYSLKPMLESGYLVNNKIQLYILESNKYEFKNSHINFDCNLLCENEKGIYIKFIPANMIYLPDKFSIIRDRILGLRFSLVENNIHNLQDLVKEAILLIDQGWIMDDFILNNKSWLVNKWLNYISNCRINNTVIEKDLTVNRNECCLCHEKFKPHDIVFNTVCNHNFHWNCNCQNGLACWMKTHTNCPLCRTIF